LGPFPAQGARTGAVGDEPVIVEETGGEQQAVPGGQLAALVGVQGDLGDLDARVRAIA
jgi:hypothetical protein